jgi:hypothetical protein
MIEFLGRFVVEIVGQLLFQGLFHVGHAVIQEFVPRLTGQRVLVAPLPDSRQIATRWYGIHRLTDGTPVIGETLATVIGLALLCITIVVAVIAIFSR